MTPRDSLECALTSLIKSGIVDNIPVMPGKNSQDKPPTPGVTCRVNCAAEEEPIYSGNWWMDAEVEFRSDAGTFDTDPLPWQIVAARHVFDLVLDPNLAANLNAQGQDLTVFEGGIVRGAHNLTFDSEQPIWIEKLPLRIYCCGTVLQP